MSPLSAIRTVRLTRVGTLIAYAALTAFAFAMAPLILYELRVPVSVWALVVGTLPYLVITRGYAWYRLRLHRVVWAHVGMREVVRLAASSAAGTIATSLILLLLGEPVALSCPFRLWL